MNRFASMGRKLLTSVWPSGWQRLPATPGPFVSPVPHGLVVLHYGDTPTLHYYWKTRYPDATYIDTASTKPDVALLSGASSIVLVRHVAPSWLQLLQQAHSTLPSISLFMDDDVPGIMQDFHLPFQYAVRTALRYGRAMKGFDSVCTSVCVSCSALARKYALPESSVLPPLPLENREPVSTEEGRGITVFYHGTASHQREIRWLRDVVLDVTDRVPGILFEVFGDKSVSRYYKGIPGVRVVHPMSWNDFLAYTDSVTFDIGLAPLLDSPFNHCRTHVKLYDITRTGGAGIYADNPVFSSVVDHEENGLLVDDSPRAWADAIVRLAGDHGLRKRLVRGAMATEAALAEATEPEA